MKLQKSHKDIIVKEVLKLASNGMKLHVIEQELNISSYKLRQFLNSNSKYKQYKTERRSELINLIMGKLDNGMTAKEIANELNISIDTIKDYLKNHENYQKILNPLKSLHN